MNLVIHPPVDQRPAQSRPDHLLANRFQRHRAELDIVPSTGSNSPAPRFMPKVGST